MMSNLHSYIFGQMLLFYNMQYKFKNKAILLKKTHEVHVIIYLNIFYLNIFSVALL
jgi:hypothetical protein